MFSIAANLRGTNRTGRLLVDSGSSLNLIEQMLVQLENPREKVSELFSMGNKKHTTTAITKLKIQGKEHVSAIVTNDFPLLEDVIIEIPYMYSYEFNLSSTHFELDRLKDKLHDD